MHLKGLDYKFWITVALSLIVLQWFVFDRVANCRVNMSALQIEAEANSVRNEIQQSILDKQRATTAIALTLSNEFSQLQLDESLASNTKVESLMAQIRQFSDYKNLWVQIVNPQGISMYRSWSPIKNNLAKIRPEFQKVIDSGQPVIGISTGYFDVSIKVVTPLLKEGEIIGFLDLISHFNSIQKRLKRIGIDSLVVATKERSLSMKHPFSPNQIGDYYVANLQPDNGFYNSISQADIERWIRMPQDHRVNGDVLLVRYPLKSVDGEVHAYLFAQSSTQKLLQNRDEVSQLRMRMNLFIIADVGIVLFLSMLIALHLMRRQKNYYRAILNYEEEAVLVTNGRQLIDANEQLYRYFPQLNKAEADCICNYFERREGYIQKQMDGLLWIDYLMQHNNEQHKAMVKVNNELCIFQLKARKLDESENHYVVVLSEITNLENLNKKLHNQSRTDALTQAGNRLAFNEVLCREVKLAQRSEQPLSIVLFDIDFFKKVNDQYGHAHGDLVLKQITATIKESLRDSDAIFRIGGEEFVLILALQDKQAAHAVAEKIRQKIAAVNFPQSSRISISLGVTQLLADDDYDSILARADKALYQAKESGRNKVIVL